MARPYTIQAEFQADFRSIEAQAKKFGNRFGKIVEDAMDLGAHPRITASLEKYLKDMKRRQEKLANYIADYEYAARIKAAGNVSDVEKSLAKEIADYESQLATAGLQESKKLEIQNNLEIAKRRDRALKKSDDAHQKQIKSMRDLMQATQRAADKAGKSARSTIERIDRGQKVMEEHAERLHKILNASATDFVSTIEDGLSGLSDSLRGSIDLGSMIKGGTSKAGSFLGGGADMLSGMAAGAEGATAALATLAAGTVAAVAAIVAVVGVFAAAMLSVDKEIKEFNKSAINTFGSRSALSYGLDNFRHAVQDLTSNLGLTEQEATGLFDALDQGGYSLQRIAKGIEDVEERNRALNTTLQQVVATSKALGVTVNEFVAQSTEMANNYATSLEDITGQFASIGKMAQEAGFSTRRFYSLVVQATSSQAGLNVRVAETAEILTRMSKILGDKQAASFLEGMGGAFATASSQDLMKTALVAGTGNVRDIAREEVKSQSRVFLGEAQRGGNVGALKEAARGAGLGDKLRIDVNNPEEFARSLNELSTDERNRLISSVTRMDSGLGRRLDDLTRLNENAEGGLTELPEAMRTFSTGGIVKTYAKMAESFGFSLDDMNAIQRTAFANISGLSEEQITQMQRLARNGEGTFSELQRMASTTGEISEEQKQEMLKQYGAYVENGKVMDENGVELTDAFDYLTTAQATGHIEDTAIMAEDLALAYKAFDETTSIGDILGNEIQNWLRGIYEDVGVPLVQMVTDILSFMGVGDDREDRAFIADQIQAFSEKVLEYSRDKAEAQKELNDLNRLRRPLTSDEISRKAEAEDKLATASAELESAQEVQRTYSAGSGSAEDRITRARGLIERREGERRSEREAASSETAFMSRVSESTESPELRAAALEEYRGLTSVPGSPGTRATGPVVDLPMFANATIDTPALNAAMAGGRATPAAAAVTVAPTTTPTPSPAPAVRPAPAPAAPTTSGAPSGSAPVVSTPSRTETSAREDATSEVVGAMEAAGDTSATATREEGSETRTTLEKEHEDTRKHLTKILTRDQKLGNALAKSDLPQAIVDAQVRQQLMSLAFSAGMTDQNAVGKAIEQYMTEGTISEGLKTALLDENVTSNPALASLAAGLGLGTRTEGPFVTGGRRRISSTEDDEGVTINKDAEMDDFVYRGDGVRGTITPIDERDTFVGMKPGGPIDRALGGGGGSVTVNIYGGDERRVYDVVKRVLQQTGIGPTRVASRA